MDCEHEANGLFAAAYFVLYMCFAAFLILNLFIGIITTEMQTAKQEAERQRAVSEKLALAATLRLRNKKKLEGGPSPKPADGFYESETNPSFARDGPGTSFDVEASNFDDEK